MQTFYSYAVAVALTVLIMIVLFVIIIAPFKDPLVYSVQPFSVDKTIYTTDDIMTIHSYRCNNEGRPLVVTTKERYFYNVNTGKRYDVASAPGTIQVGCSWQEARVVRGFPDEMPSGRYVKQGITIAHGSLRTVEVPWITEPFDYVKTS